MRTTGPFPKPPCGQPLGALEGAGDIALGGVQPASSLFHTIPLPPHPQVFFWGIFCSFFFAPGTSDQAQFQPGDGLPDLPERGETPLSFESNWQHAELFVPTS